MYEEPDISKLTEEQKRCVRFHQVNTFIEYMHGRAVMDGEGDIVLAMTIQPELSNMHNIAHGGVMMAMADNAMGAAAMQKNKKVVTMELGMDFMHAVPLMKTVYAKGKVLHNGRKTLTIECEIKDEEGKLYAKAHGTFFVLGLFDEKEG